MGPNQGQGDLPIDLAGGAPLGYLKAFRVDFSHKSLCPLLSQIDCASPQVQVGNEEKLQLTGVFKVHNWLPQMIRPGYSEFVPSENILNQESEMSTREFGPMTQ